MATDFDPRYTEDNLRRKQRYTIAHEMGHILLHPQYDWGALDPNSDLYQRLEVEANWFAARLLIPDYIFKTIADLDPEKLAVKCDVNFSAAKKRLDKLSDQISLRLIQEHLDKRPDWVLEEIEESTDAEIVQEIVWWADEVAATMEEVYGGIRCSVCGHYHTEGLVEIFPFCQNCDTLLVP